MTTHGKSIRIYLPDGTPTGIRLAELMNWTGQAIMCPRGRVAELAEWQEASRPGVYILTGEAEIGDKPTAYIGEAENVLARLPAHFKGKDFWTRVTFFTSKDDYLTKVHVKYLEARLVELALAAGRADLQNGNAPQRPALPRSDRDAMEEFLGPIGLLLGTLGLNLLQPITSTAPGATAATAASGTTGVRLQFEGGDAISASGMVTDEGFVVLAGSRGSLESRPSLQSGNVTRRQQLLASGDLVETGGDLVFQADVLFPSPSAAGAAVAGRETNGRDVWKTERGVSLKELEEAEAAAAEVHRRASITTQSPSTPRAPA